MSRSPALDALMAALATAAPADPGDVTGPPFGGKFTCLADGQYVGLINPQPAMVCSLVDGAVTLGAHVYVTGYDSTNGAPKVAGVDPTDAAKVVAVGELAWVAEGGVLGLVRLQGGAREVKHASTTAGALYVVGTDGLPAKSADGNYPGAGAVIVPIGPGIGPDRILAIPVAGAAAPGGVTLGLLGSHTAGQGASLVGLQDAANYYTTDNAEAAFVQIGLYMARLALANNASYGGALVGVHDPGNYFTTDNVNAVLQQIGAALASGVAPKLTPTDVGTNPWAPPSTSGVFTVLGLGATINVPAGLPVGTVLIWDGTGAMGDFAIAAPGGESLDTPGIGTVLVGWVCLWVKHSSTGWWGVQFPSTAHNDGAGKVIPQTVTGAGALSVTCHTSFVQPAATGVAYTLADGRYPGQRKRVAGGPAAFGGNDGDVTPAHPDASYTKFNVSAARAWVDLEWTGSVWVITALSATGATVM